MKFTGKHLLWGLFSSKAENLLNPEAFYLFFFFISGKFCKIFKKRLLQEPFQVAVSDYPK